MFNIYDSIQVSMYIIFPFEAIWCHFQMKTSGVGLYFFWAYIDDRNIRKYQKYKILGLKFLQRTRIGIFCRKSPIFQKKIFVKKKIASTILEKSKIPSIQVVKNNICNNLYRRNFWFFQNCGRYFFLTAEKIPASTTIFMQPAIYKME